MSQFSFTRNLPPAATCCHLQFRWGRTWLSGRTCAPELVASWRRGVVHVETAPMGGRGHEIPHCIAVHSASISIQYIPISSRVSSSTIMSSSTREVCPSSRETYMICWVICFVYFCLVNLCELYEHPSHDESSVQGDEIGQLKISQSPNTWM